MRPSSPWRSPCRQGRGAPAAPRTGSWVGRPSSPDRQAGQEGGGGRGEAVAAVEGGSRRRPVEVRPLDRHGQTGNGIEEGLEKTVVGADQVRGLEDVPAEPSRGRAAAARCPPRDRPPPGAPRRAGRGQGGGQQEGALFDVARRHLVADVDQGGAGGPGQDHAFDRRHVIIARAKIGEEGQNRRGRRHGDELIASPGRHPQYEEKSRSCRPASRPASGDRRHRREPAGSASSPSRPSRAR